MPNTFTTPKPIPELSLDPPVIYLDILVKEIEKVLLLYDRIEIWRSTDNVTYTEITDVDDLPATVDGSVTGPWALSGKTLTVAKNSASPISLTFGGVDPLDLKTVISNINTVFNGPVYKMAKEVPTNTNKLRLVSDITGLESNLTISGNAASTLGLSTTITYGKNHRPILTYPTIRYRFYDTSATVGTTYYYKYRYSNSKTGRLSNFSDYILGDPLPLLTSDLINCYIKLADHNGNPVRDKRIVIFLQRAKVFGSNSTINIPLIGVMEQRIEMITDQFGFAKSKIPKNTEIKVFIEDSFINRVINTGTVDFDLLDRISTTPDPFNLVITDPIIPVVAVT